VQTVFKIDLHTRNHKDRES